MRLSSCLQRSLFPLASRLSNPVLGKSPKTLTADEAVSMIDSGDNIYVHGHAATPTELLYALGRRIDSHGISVKLIHILLCGKSPLFDKKYAEKARSNCLFLCNNTRKLVKEGRNPLFIH
ncbi:hypothetical protein COOONC_17298 [Cooperia oncophora]